MGLYQRQGGRRDNAVGIATSYGLVGRGVGVRVPVGARCVSFPRRPVRFWGPLGLVSSEYLGLFPRRQSGRGLKLTTHLQLFPRSRVRGSIHPLHYTSLWRIAYLVKYRDNFSYLSLQPLWALADFSVS
jgi:hypothetical protein